MLPAVNKLNVFVSNSLAGRAASLAEYEELMKAMQTINKAESDGLVPMPNNLYVLSETLSYIAGVFNAIFILVTFGAVTPLLACVIIAALFIIMTRWRALLASFLMEIYSLNHAVASAEAEGPAELERAKRNLAPQLLLLALLEMDCRTLPKQLFKDSLWFVMQLSATFFALFMVDIIGDQSKNDSLIIASATLIFCTPLLLRLARRAAKKAAKPGPAAFIAKGFKWISTFCSPIDIGEDQDDNAIVSDLINAKAKKNKGVELSAINPIFTKRL
jgi:hypothetical protein